MEGIYPQDNQLQGLAMTNDLWPLWRISWAGAHATEQDLTSVGPWCPLSLPLECVACGDGWVVML